MALKDLPSDAQPREKLLARGPGALSDAELLALLLRTGMAGKGVLQLAAELLAEPPMGFGGISGLLNTSAEDLNRIKGLGPAKRAELVAVLELARRGLAEQLRERVGLHLRQRPRGPAGPPAEERACRCQPIHQDGV